MSEPKFAVIFWCGVISGTFASGLLNLLYVIVRCKYLGN